jgi:hypothetical protein
MSTTPLTPAMLKGAMVSVSLTALPSLVLFQYNPEALTRTLQPRVAKSGGDDFGWEGGESQRIAGPPRESIRFTLELDATDGLETSDRVATTVGIAPALAALEMMVTPATFETLAAQLANEAGVIEAIPVQPPVTLLFLGPTRLLPVRVDSLGITEEAFDPLLYPIRAKVEVELTVLGPSDLEDDNPAYLWALNYSTIAKAALALLGSAQAAGEAGGAVLKAIGI